MSPRPPDQATAELALLESAVAEDPGSRLFLRLAQAQMACGRLDQARQTLEKGLLLRPEEVEGRRLLARVLRAQGDEVQALEQLSLAATVMSRQAGLYSELAELLTGLGREPQALVAQRLAQDLAADLGGPAPAPASGSQDTPTLAEIYAAQGLYAKAAQIYGRLLAAEPGNARLAERLAELEGWQAQAPPAPLAEEPARQALSAPILGHLEALRAAALARAGQPPLEDGPEVLAGLRALREAALTRVGDQDRGQSALLERLQALKRSALARAAAGS